jgi:hypothetical protein
MEYKNRRNPKVTPVITLFDSNLDGVQHIQNFIPQTFHFDR